MAPSGSRKWLEDGERVEFLEALRQGKTIAEACSVSGVSKQRAYYWKNEDPEFQKDWDAAKVAYKQDLLDQAEEHLRNRALDATDRYSHILLIFMLKRLDPEYKENYKREVTVTHQNEALEYEFTPDEVDKALKILKDAKKRQD